jgi:predicted nucleic acid-binding protein
MAANWSSSELLIAELLFAALSKRSAQAARRNAAVRSVSPFVQVRRAEYGRVRLVLRHMTNGIALQRRFAFAALVR